MKNYSKKLFYGADCREFTDINIHGRNKLDVSRSSLVICSETGTV